MAYCSLGGIVLGQDFTYQLLVWQWLHKGHILAHARHGASAGAFVKLTFNVRPLLLIFVPQFVICAMGGMLAAMRTPILAILLVLEMTNSFSNIYAIGTVTLVAYLVAELLKSRQFTIPILQAMTGQSHLRISAKPLPNEGACSSKLYRGAVQDLALPDGTLISIRRNGTYIVPLGDVKT